jgi:hypothetical protein
MPRFRLIIFLIAITHICKSQHWVPIPIPSIEYVNQTKHTVGTYLSMNRFCGKDTLHYHSFFRIGAGGVFYGEKNILYCAPSVAIDCYYQAKKNFGPRLRIGYTNYYIAGKTDNYLWSDLGMSLYGVYLFAGYSWNLDYKDLKQIAPFRVGIKVP